MNTLILASTSPYRRSLLGRLPISFETIAPGVDETPHKDETALALCERLAKEKARAVLSQRPEAWVIGSDQVAACQGRILGKPGSPEKALEQLQWQLGKTTEFHTALCLARKTADSPTFEIELQQTVVTTRVVWRPAKALTRQQLIHYIARENPIDCAGAAKSEGLGTVLLQAIEGSDPTALIGLPLIALSDMLIAWGWDPLPPPPA